MSNCLVLAGRYYNAIARALLANPSAVTATDSNANFPVANVADGFPNAPHRMSTAGASMRLDCDLNMIPNPGFETAFASGLPAATTTVAIWAKSSGATLTRNTVSMRTGAGALQVAGTAGTEYAYIDLVVMAGEKWRFDLWGRKQGAGGPALVRIRNLDTRSYMTSAGVWQAASTDFLNNNTTSYVQATADTTMETPTTSLSREMTVRVYFYAGGAAAAETLYDDLAAWPNGGNFVSIHGHNVSQGVTVELVGASTATPTNVRATLTPRQPAYYKTLTATLTDRYIGLRFTNADLNPAGAIWTGEWVFGQSLALARKPDWRLGNERIDPQRRSTTETGQIRTFLLTSGGRHILTLPFRYFDPAQMTEARDQVIAHTRGGAYPLVVVPSDADPEVVVHGHIVSDRWGFRWNAPYFYQADDLVVAEDPFPTFVP